MTPLQHATVQLGPPTTDITMKVVQIIKIIPD